MNSVHYDVILYTKDTEKAANKINELMQKHNETIFKAIPNVKYITDKRTYKIETNFRVRGNRYYEAYIDDSIDQRIVEECIYPYCLPYTDNWRDRMHTF